MAGKGFCGLGAAALAMATGACTGGSAPSNAGFLTTYEGLAPRTDVVRASVAQRRDEALASSITRLWAAPAEIFGVNSPVLSDDDQRAVLHEVDRQLCYELSERFEIAEQLEPQAGTVRVGVTYIRPTHQVGSAAAAVANFFIPGPIKVRATGGTGGLGAEAELLAPDGRQAAAVVWRRDAMVVGTDKPSLSRIGDAHQLAEPLGDMVTDSAGATTEIVGAGTGYGANAAFAVTRLDASDTVSQVLVSTFTGGAHCCSVLTVVESRDGAWRTYDLGSWDGDTPAMPRDLDGDGVKEFRFVDQAFLYAFASYAESWAPPVIQNRVDGRIEDVSKASVYRPVFDKAAADSRIACLERSNGACAAYVASAARAGRLDGAWAEMLDAYDQASDWTLPTACRVRTSGSCPVGAEMTFSTFPEALQWFLGEHGYTRKVYIAPLDATGPSYDCGAARTVSERAICRSSDLAMLDRTLAVAYSRAMALARDRAALRATQRSFHQAKWDEGDPVRLAALYENRIDELLAID